MKKIILGATLFSTLVLAGCASQDATVASTTAGKISESELYEELKSSYGSQVLQNMLIEDVLESRYGEQITDEAIEAVVQEDMETLGGEEAFQQYISQQNITMEDYREAAKLALLMRQAVSEHEGVSEETLKEYYETWEPNLTASHILVEEKETADDIIKQLEGEAEWNELVKEYSIDTASVANNGQMTFGKGQMVQEFEEAAFALEEGQTTDKPVETAYGYHIIRMDEKPKKGTFEEERENVEKLIMDEMMADTKKVRDAISAVAAEANIIVEDDALQGALVGLLPEPAVEEEPVENTEEESKEENSEEESKEETSE